MLRTMKAISTFIFCSYLATSDPYRQTTTISTDDSRISSTPGSQASHFSVIVQNQKLSCVLSHTTLSASGIGASVRSIPQIQDDKVPRLRCSWPGDRDDEHRSQKERTLKAFRSGNPPSNFPTPNSGHTFGKICSTDRNNTTLNP